MKKILLLCMASVTLLAVSCTKSGSGDLVGSGLSSGSLAGPSSGGDTTRNVPGVITAGEWNDLDHWTFWDSLMVKEPFAAFAPYWSFYPGNRVAVHVTTPFGNPVMNAVIQLKKDGATKFTARTDNQGRAELWADLFAGTGTVSLSGYTLTVNNGMVVATVVKPFRSGVNELVLGTASAPAPKMEIAFVVDATSSMGDELTYLQKELNDVISRAHAGHPAYNFLTSSVFYRDKGDEYVTKVSGFTANKQTTIDFIKAQRANGGGDFPEAVHTALEKSITELQWSDDAKTRILFLLLDAPPHHEPADIASIQNMAVKAAEKGIKIIPVTASGINKETEFLMRFLSVTTNGTYVFITNHSGIGGNHIQATVGPYNVEYLNNLMVRLIGKYAQ